MRGLMLKIFAIAAFSAVMTLGCAAQQKTTSPVTLNVAAALKFNQTALPGAIVGQSYSFTLTFTGGVAPITCALASGSTLPPGLSLSTACVISGTPTTQGDYTFSVTATDSSGSTARLEIHSRSSAATSESGAK